MKTFCLLCCVLVACFLRLCLLLLAALGVLLGRSWPLLGFSWTQLGALGTLLGHSGGTLGTLLGALGALLGALGALLAGLWAHQNRSSSLPGSLAARPQGVQKRSRRRIRRMWAPGAKNARDYSHSESGGGGEERGSDPGPAPNTTRG